MKLEEFRKEINEVDWRLLRLFKKRFDISEKISLVKKDLKLPIKDKKREQAVILDKIVKGQKIGLSKDFIVKVWKIFFKESKRIQRL